MATGKVNMIVMRNIRSASLFILLFLVQFGVSGQSFVASITSDESDLCLGDSIAAYIYFSGGTSPWDAVINDKDGEFLVLDGITSPYTLYLSPDTANTYYIATAVDSDAVPGNPAGEVAIDVHEATEVSIMMDRTAFLQSEPGVDLISVPSGGAFTGAGVTVNVFYPEIATAVGSPHTVTCIYTNQYGCESDDDIELHVLSGVASVVLVTGSDTINAICDDGATYYIRGSNEDNIPGSFELLKTGSQNPVQGSITDSDPNDDEAILDPSGLSGAYDIVYTYSMEDVAITSTYRLHVNDLGEIEIANLPDTVCRNADPYPLIPALLENDPEATYSFSGPGVTGNFSEGYYFDPSSPEVVERDENEIQMDYTSSNGCIADNSITTVYVAYIPAVDFGLSLVCIPEDGGVVSFTNLTSGKFSVENWQWDFGDPGSGSENTSGLEHPDHFYNLPGYREISLTAITYDGCMTSHMIDTILVDQPFADFTWLNDCFIRGKHTSLLDQSVSTYTEIDTLVWTFKTKSGGVLGLIGSGSSSDTIEFPFTSKDQYAIELYIENEVGCSDNVSKDILLKPIHVLSGVGYEEDFDGDADDWLVMSHDQQESWVLGTPDFEGFDQIQDDQGWYTDLPAHTGDYLEQSWIQSPCFDFSKLKKPMIQMDLMKSFVPGTDGAVLQYQDFVSEGWKIIGNVGGGLNWYNELGIYHEPGGSQFGWGLALFDPDSDWVVAGHDLDLLVGKPHVKFRVVIASTGAQELEVGQFNQGFAFDNFILGERHRSTLLEHFTNAASTAAKDADDLVDAFITNVSGHVIDLQYHMDFPGEDAMNENNPYPPSARSFYYGVQGVPYAVLNGGVDTESRYDFSGPNQVPDEEALKMASLEIPVFDLLLQVDYQQSKLDATVTVTCKANSFTSNLQLYMVVLERDVTAYLGANQDTSFRNVVLDMLPTPAGKLLGGDWYKWKSETKTFSWDYPAFVEDLEDLSVVAFVQDRDNGKVLQAEQIPLYPDVGIAHKDRKPEYLSLFPNPASNYIYVNFGEEVRIPGQIQIMDLSGRKVVAVEVQPGYSLQQLNISHLSDGIYVVSWVDSGVVKGRQKVVVTR